MDLLLHNLRTIGTHHCDQSVGEEAAQEIERLRADADLLEWLLGEAQATSLDMGGKHRWRFESAHRWPAAPTMRASLEAYRAAMTPNATAKGPARSDGPA